MQLVLKEFTCCDVPDLDWVNVLQDLLAYEIVMCFYDQFFNPCLAPSSRS